MHKKIDGTLFPSEVLLSRVEFNGREVLQGVVRDITERWNSERQLQRAKKFAEAAKIELEKTNQKLAKANRELEKLTFIDGLTGVSNRRHFDQVLDNEWRRALRNQNPLSLIMIDIDHFKRYNDHYGHQEGDECLKKVAKTLSRMAKRPGDLVARYGGEEFAIILSDTISKSALKLAEETKEAVLSLKIPHSTSQVCENVTVSLGLTSLTPDSDLSPQNLIKAADRALYKAKNEGRNQVQIFDNMVK